MDSNIPPLPASTPEQLAEINNKAFMAPPNRLKNIDWLGEDPQIDWLVEGRFHAKGLAQVVGPPYSGKTLYVLSLALSVAAGFEEWMGYPLETCGEPQHVVYVAAEGGPAFWIHVDAWLKEHPLANKAAVREHFHVLDGGEGDILEVQTEGKVEHEVSIERLWVEMDRVGAIDAALIVYDTQVDLSPGINENDNPAMVTLLRQLKLWADQGGHLAIVVHHTGHDGTRARGASGQRAKVDVQVSVVPVSKSKTHKQVIWSEAKIKGQPQPESNDGFETVGVQHSRGAVARPISNITLAVAKHSGGEPEEELRLAILTSLAGGPKSKAAMLKEPAFAGVGDKTLAAALEWLKTDSQVYRQGKNKGTLWFAGAWSDSE